jgi:hypothetical protein
MARTKKTPPKEPLRVVTIKIPQSAETILEHLSQEATDRLGWTVSSSAVIRALIQYAGQESPARVVEILHPLIEQEIAAGRVWGSKKRGQS